MKRPRYCPKAAKVGERAEVAFHNWLHTTNLEHTWNNEHSESHLIDFYIMVEDEQVGVEVESKDVRYKHLFDQGLDFLAAKVDKYVELKDTVYYVLILSDLSGFYIISMSDIETYGELINKKNKRNWDGEMFYRVSLEDVPFRSFNLPK